MLSTTSGVIFSSAKYSANTASSHATSSRPRSNSTDLIITGLIGLHPLAESEVEVTPLVPASWDYFALDDVLYHGNRLSVVWDRTGDHYQRGQGLMIFADGEKIASRKDIGRLKASIAYKARKEKQRMINFAVNNEKEGSYPQMKCSSAASDHPVRLIQDGAYWYHISPPNRWTSAEPGAKAEWVEVDFGVPRPVQMVKLYLLDDTGKQDFIGSDGFDKNIYRKTKPTTVVAPKEVALQYKKDDQWVPVPEVEWKYSSFSGGKAQLCDIPRNEHQVAARRVDPARRQDRRHDGIRGPGVCRASSVATGRIAAALHFDNSKWHPRCIQAARSGRTAHQ